MIVPGDDFQFALMKTKTLLVEIAQCDENVLKYDDN